MAEVANFTSFLANGFPRQLPAEAARVLHLHEQLQSFELLDTSDQDSLLLAQLENLLTHAKRASPYWRENLSSWVPGKSPLAETLSALPSLSRADLGSQFERIVANYPQKTKMRTSRTSTSGSTGTPVSVEHLVDVHNPLQGAGMLLAARWHKLDSQKSLGTVLTTVQDVERAPLGIPFSWYGPVGIGFARCAKDRDYGELYDYCVQKQPDYLLSGATMFAGLANYAIQNNRRDLHPEKVLSFASTVTDETREIVQEGLGAKIIDRYSTEEAGMIAVQCPKHNHFHVLSPLVMVEIVDDSGAPCPVGQPGRVLLTVMQSYAMPLIRYEIGDMAEWGEPCDCGIKLPVIKKLWGRLRHMITHPDGRTTYAVLYVRDFENVANLEAYRFVLHQNTTIDAQLKVKEQSPELARSVTETVQRALTYPYPVNIRYVDEIDWGKSWKKESFAVSDAPVPKRE